MYGPLHFCKDRGRLCGSEGACNIAAATAGCPAGTGGTYRHSQPAPHPAGKRSFASGRTRPASLSSARAEARRFTSIQIAGHGDEPLLLAQEDLVDAYPVCAASPPSGPDNADGWPARGRPRGQAAWPLEWPPRSRRLAPGMRVPVFTLPPSFASIGHSGHNAGGQLLD